MICVHNGLSQQYILSHIAEGGLLGNLLKTVCSPQNYTVFFTWAEREDLIEFKEKW